MSELSESRLWRRSEDAAYVETQGRVALVDLGHPERAPMILQGSAALIWQLLDLVIEEEALVARVAEQFLMEPEAVRASVVDFLAQLQELGLVERAST